MSTGARTIVVVGAGYVGFVTSPGIAMAGDRIRSAANEPCPLAMLRAGTIQPLHAGLQAKLGLSVADGRLLDLALTSSLAFDRRAVGRPDLRPTATEQAV